MDKNLYPVEWAKLSSTSVVILHMTYSGHFADHLPTPSCPRSFWMTPYPSETPNNIRFSTLICSVEERIVKGELLYLV